ncbi:hypothetical protein, partial [Nostoc sp. NMS9]|uniref:hypothetical protein n=1 Tax=Nostoc sp. NMS9 TaxID=2815393 RepID=UPI0025F983AA
MLVIPLRNYANAASVEFLFSEFFFRQYKIPIPHYEAFVQLNRMGKLLLIFDGFDEMAAKVDQQKMINNPPSAPPSVTEGNYWDQKVKQEL